MFKKRESHISAGTGISYTDDPEKAGREAVVQACMNAERHPDFAVVYASSGKYGRTKESLQKLAKGVDAELKQLNPHCKWIGCTSREEISNHGYTENSVVVLVMSSEYMHFGVGIGKGAKKTPHEAGKKAAQAALKDVTVDKNLDSFIQSTAVQRKGIHELLLTGNYFFLTLFPGFTFEYEPKDNEIIRGIQEAIGSQHVYGGEASDMWEFKQSFTMANGTVYDDTVVFATVISYLKIAGGVKHGYKPTDKVLLVTKMEGNIVYEINNRPAAQVYSELTGHPMDELKAGMLDALTEYPTGVQYPDGSYWLNCPYAVGPDDSLIFFEELQPGWKVLILMQATKKDVIESARTAVESVTNSIKDIGALFVFSCSARLWYLKEEIQKECEIVKKAGKESPFIGFNSYAEISRIPSGSVYKHGYTFVCVGVSEHLITD